MGRDVRSPDSIYGLHPEVAPAVPADEKVSPDAVVGAVRLFAEVALNLIETKCIRVPPADIRLISAHAGA